MGTQGVLLELGALILAVGVLGRVSSALGLSPIPFYLLIGLTLGTIGAGPLTFSEELIEIGAEIGLVLLLFLLGLEYAGREIVGTLRTTAPAGALDLVFNFTPGFVAGLALGWGWEAAFVLGGVTYISSSGVISKVVEDLGRRRHPETRTMLSLLVLEDLVMALYLPVLAVVVAGAGLARGAISVTVAALCALGALWFASRHGQRVSRVLSPRSEEAFLLTIFGLVLLVAGIAEEVQLSAAVGAFLAGIALAEPVDERARNVLSPLRDVFAATFFVFFGLQVDVADAIPLLWVVALLVVVTSVTKLAVGWWAAGRIGVNRAGRLRAGTALIARGEFSMVIAGLGVAAGVESRIAAAAAGYVLITAILGTVTTRWVEGPEAERDPEWADERARRSRGAGSSGRDRRSAGAGR